MGAAAEASWEDAGALAVVEAVAGKAGEGPLGEGEGPAGSAEGAVEGERMMMLGYLMAGVAKEEEERSSAQLVQSFLCPHHVWNKMLCNV